MPRTPGPAQTPPRRRTPPQPRTQLQPRTPAPARTRPRPRTPPTAEALPGPGTGQVHPTARSKHLRKSLRNEIRFHAPPEVTPRGSFWEFPMHRTPRPHRSCSLRPRPDEEPRPSPEPQPRPEPHPRPRPFPDQAPARFTPQQEANASAKPSATRFDSRPRPKSRLADRFGNFPSPIGARSRSAQTLPSPHNSRLPQRRHQILMRQIHQDRRRRPAHIHQIARHHLDLPFRPKPHPPPRRSQHVPLVQPCLLY